MKKFDFVEDPNDPISSMNEEEFIEYVANDCTANMSEEDKQCFREDPDPVSYHFGYGTSIRNTYIYGKNLPFFVPFADDLSEFILERIIDILNRSSL